MGTGAREPGHGSAMSMQGEVLLVTGGARGIGAAIARLAGVRGCSVAICFEHAAAAAAGVVDDIGKSGARARAFRADVSRYDEVMHLFDAVCDQLGPLTAVVNNAGITGPIGPFAMATSDALARVLDVNVLGTMLCTQQAVRRWLAAGRRGCIVNISSAAATLGAPGEYVHYAASKAAIDAFTVGLAKELGSAGIRINAVAPGTTRTDIHARAGDPHRPERVAARVPAGRIAEPLEIAEAALWLLSPQASHVSGSVLRVAGGI